MSRRVYVQYMTILHAILFFHRRQSDFFCIHCSNIRKYIKAIIYQMYVQKIWASAMHASPPVIRLLSQASCIYAIPRREMHGRAQPVRVTAQVQLKMNSLVTGALDKSGLSKTQLQMCQSKHRG